MISVVLFRDRMVSNCLMKLFAVWRYDYISILYELRQCALLVIELIALAPAPASLTVFGRGP